MLHHLDKQENKEKICKFIKEKCNLEPFFSSEFIIGIPNFYGLNLHKKEHDLIYDFLKKEIKVFAFSLDTNINFLSIYL